MQNPGTGREGQIMPGPYFQLYFQSKNFDLVTLQVLVTLDDHNHHIKCHHLHENIHIRQVNPSPHTVGQGRTIEINAMLMFSFLKPFQKTLKSFF